MDDGPCMIIRIPQMTSKAEMLGVHSRFVSLAQLLHEHTHMRIKISKRT